MKNGVALFICPPKKTDSSRCSDAGCSNTTAAYCSFKLKGKHAGKTCSRALCTPCSGNDKLCSPHRRLMARGTTG